MAVVKLKFPGFARLSWHEKRVDEDE